MGNRTAHRTRVVHDWAPHGVGEEGHEEGLLVHGGPPVHGDPSLDCGEEVALDPLVHDEGAMDRAPGMVA